MTELNVNIDDFSDQTPKEPGNYFWWAGDIVSIRLITVIHIPAKSAYGMEWDSYLGVTQHRNSCVDKLSGKFLKVNYIG